jgi:hypothetical protein
MAPLHEPLSRIPHTASHTTHIACMLVQHWQQHQQDNRAPAITLMLR